MYSLKTFQLMRENVVFLVIFDTCDVICIIGPLLPPIVLDNLFGLYKQGRTWDGKGGWGYTIEIET